MHQFSYAFRVDASLEIGHGHLMRCLTLADELSKYSHRCYFICNKLEKNLVKKISAMGHELFEINTDSPFNWNVDAKLTKKIITTVKVDWLVVDHYSIDFKWENEAKGAKTKIMVIDDLANRTHNCDILLDGNLGKTKEHYKSLIPSQSIILAGIQHCLIREEFLMARPISLKNRLKNKGLKNILISIGASDPKNLTLDILEKLEKYGLANDCTVSTIISSVSPHLPVIQKKLLGLNFHSLLLKDVSNMAEILLKQDIVIGGVGVSAWERCVLGTPSISIVAAQNQLHGAKALHQSKASIVIDQDFSEGYDISKAIDFYMSKFNLTQASQVAANLADGKGASRAARFLM